MTFVKGNTIGIETRFNKGVKHPSWFYNQNGLGEYKSSSGYWMIGNRTHPRANSYGYVKRAVLVVEKYLGKCPLSSEAVHHINGIKDDDHPENLYLFSSHSEHRKYHLRPFQLESNLLG